MHSLQICRQMQESSLVDGVALFVYCTASRANKDLFCLKIPMCSFASELDFIGIFLQRKIESFEIAFIFLKDCGLWV